MVKYSFLFASCLLVFVAQGSQDAASSSSSSFSSQSSVSWKKVIDDLQKNTLEFGLTIGTHRDIGFHIRSRNSFNNTCCESGIKTKFPEHIFKEESHDLTDRSAELMGHVMILMAAAFKNQKDFVCITRQELLLLFNLASKEGFDRAVNLTADKLNDLIQPAIEKSYKAGYDEGYREGEIAGYQSADANKFNVFDDGLDRNILNEIFQQDDNHVSFSGDTYRTSGDMTSNKEVKVVTNAHGMKRRSCGIELNPLGAVSRSVKSKRKKS